MKPSKKKKVPIQHLVPNNPQADKQLTGGGDWDAKAEAEAKKKTLYDSSYKTAAGHWKQHDEPDEEEQYRQADRINQVRKARREKESLERLKYKGAVPTKDGKKLFDEFMQEVLTHRFRSLHSFRKGGRPKWIYREGVRQVALINHKGQDPDHKTQSLK